MSNILEKLIFYRNDKIKSLYKNITIFISVGLSFMIYIFITTGISNLIIINTCHISEYENCLCHNVTYDKWQDTDIYCNESYDYLNTKIAIIDFIFFLCFFPYFFISVYLIFLVIFMLICSIDYLCFYYIKNNSESELMPLIVHI